MGVALREREVDEEQRERLPKMGVFLRERGRRREEREVARDGKTEREVFSDEREKMRRSSSCQRIKFPSLARHHHSVSVSPISYSWPDISCLPNHAFSSLIKRLRSQETFLPSFFLSVSKN